MKDRGPSVLLRPTEAQVAHDTNKVLERGQVPSAPSSGMRHVLRVHDPAAGAHYYIYVDNLGVLSQSKDDAKARLDGIIRALEGFGLVVHETEISSGKIETLGVELD